MVGTAAAQSVSVDVVDVSDFFPDSLPVADELFVFVHGWFGDTTVESQAEDVANSLAAGGYVADESVAIEWDATLDPRAAETDEKRPPVYDSGPSTPSPPRPSPPAKRSAPSMAVSIAREPCQASILRPCSMGSPRPS